MTSSVVDDVTLGRSQGMCARARSLGYTTPLIIARLVHGKLNFNRVCRNRGGDQTAGFT